MKKIILLFLLGITINTFSQNINETFYQIKFHTTTDSIIDMNLEGDTLFKPNSDSGFIIITGKIYNKWRNSKFKIVFDDPKYKDSYELPDNRRTKMKLHKFLDCKKTIKHNYNKIVLSNKK